MLVASYAVDKGKKAESLFGHLAERMDREPDLEVRFFLNVHRKNHRDETPESVLLRQFADTFRHQIWPGERLPAVFHDPRSLAVGGATRACLHAKCIVVDEERALITSANFTAAAQERNIEAGVTIADAVAGPRPQGAVRHLGGPWGTEAGSRAVRVPGKVAVRRAAPYVFTHAPARLDLLAQQRLQPAHFLPDPRQDLLRACQIACWGAGGEIYCAPWGAGGISTGGRPAGPPPFVGHR